jgi:hypothetical protein
MLYPHAVDALTTADVETRSKLREHRSGQPLGEDVSELGGHRDAVDTHICNGDTLTDEVEVDLNMLGELMLDGVGGEVDYTAVVAVN